MVRFNVNSDTLCHGSEKILPGDQAGAQHKFFCFQKHVLAIEVHSLCTETYYGCWFESYRLTVFCCLSILISILLTPGFA